MGVPVSKIARPRSLPAPAGVGRRLLAIGLALVPAFAVAQPSPRLVPIVASPSAPSAADGLPPLVPITREQLAAVASRDAAPADRSTLRPGGLVPIAFAPASTIAALPPPASPPRPLPVRDTLRSLPVEAALPPVATPPAIRHAPQPAIAAQVPAPVATRSVPPVVSQAPTVPRPSAAAQPSVVTPPPLPVAPSPVILPPLPSLAAQTLPPVAAPQNQVLAPVAPPPAGATAPAAPAQPLPPLPVVAQSPPLPAPALPLPPLSVAAPLPVASAAALPPPLPALPTAPLPAPVPAAQPLPPLPAVGVASSPVPAQEPAAVALSAPAPVAPPAPPSSPLPAPVAPQAASVPPPAAAPGAPSPVPAAPGKPADAITIGSFNIQVFGESKIAKPQVVDVLVRVVRGFDVVAIQEVRAKSDGVIPQFISAINADGSRYQYVIGPRLGRTSSKEQYVFIYDTTRIELDPSSVGTSPNPGDRLHRPPLHARFRTRANPPEAGFSFWLVDTHTDPDEVKQEVDALAQVFMEMKALRPDEDDVILLGDLNASPQQFGRIRQIPGIGWAVSGVPTNTRRNKTYDNIIFDQAATAEYTGRWGVLDLQNTFGLSLDKALEVSDHNPVWATFRPWEARQLAAADAAAAVR